MSTITHSRNRTSEASPYWPDTRPRLALRLRTAARRTKLTQALAAGAQPDSSPELALRATQLTSRRHRNVLARTVGRVIEDAHRAPLTRGHMVIIRRHAALEAESQLLQVRERLSGSEPVDVRGMAMLEQIITNGERSPLYNNSERGALQRALSFALAAMDGAAVDSHEFPLH